MAQDQVNPNALAAPAEGFGQTVSFAFDPRGDVPTVQPITSSARGMGVSGGSGVKLSDPAAGYEPPAERDPTGALLMKVGEEILSKKLDEQRTVKFVEGMQRAMSGEAITEVVASVPWYAKLFGDTPAIEGARAYTAAAKVNEQVAKQTANMPAIQSLDTAAAAKHFSGVINQSLTGDPGTDNVIMKGMTEQLPALMKAQAKAHYGYIQKQAMTALSRNIETGAEGLQAYGQLFAEDKVTEVDMDKMSKSYIASIMPPEGIDEENYTKTLTGNMRRMAATGQFHALAALKKSGVMQALTPEQAGQVESATMAAATKTRDNYAFKFAREIAEIKSDAINPPEGQTPAEIAGRIDGMNAKYQKLTGSPVGLFSSDQKADMIAGTFNAIKAEQVRATRFAETLASRNATAAEKEAATAGLATVVTKLVADGDIDALKRTKGVTDDMIDLAVLDAATKDPEAGGSVLANAWAKTGYINRIIQNRMLLPLRQAEGRETPPDGWFSAVAKFNELKAGPGGLRYAADYFGEFAPKMERASRMLGENVFGHTQSAAIFQATMGGTQEIKPDPLSPKEREAVVKQVTDLNSNWLVRKFTGRVNLRPDALALVTEVSKENIADWRGTDMTDTEATSMGISDAVTAGKLELVGGYGIRNYDYRPGGKRPPTLKELASSPTNTVPTDKEDDYFASFMKDKLKVPQAGSVRIMRMGAGGGAHKFRVIAMPSDGGKPYDVIFTSDDWQRYAAELTTKDTKPNAQAWVSGNAALVANGDPFSEKARFAAEMAAKQSKLNRPQGR